MIAAGVPARARVLFDPATGTVVGETIQEQTSALQ
jgi:hypothetical protein